MLHLLDDYDGSPEARRHLADGFQRYLAAVSASAGGGDRSQVERVEADVKANPAGTIRFDEVGFATVTAGGRRYQGGRFEIRRLGDLKARATAARERAGRPAARAALWVFDGAGPLTDIGSLQATAEPGSVFQVASQFNCLESPGPYVVDVARYFDDPTQGPRASISAFPGTLVRHYAAPGEGGGRFVQSTGGPQLDLLSDVTDARIACVNSGYLRPKDIVDPASLVAALNDRFEAIRVGVHDGVEVVLGYDWDGGVDGAPQRRIAQVFTSTLAGGMYGAFDEDDEIFLAVCRQLQRAAYLGALLAGVALDQRRVALTLIGGGVFDNPIAIIWESILWAVDSVADFLHRDLVVVVNGRNLSRQLPDQELSAAARARGGALCRFGRTGAEVIPG